MNNKLLIALISAMIIGTEIFSQTTDGKSVRLGVKLSPNIGWYNSPDAALVPAGAMGGFGFGLIAEFKLAKNNNYGFVTGLNITNQGGKLEYQSVAQEGSNPTLFFQSKAVAEQRTRYIDIPLMLKLKTNEIGYMTYFFNVGLVGGINVRSVQDLTLTYNNGTSEKSQIITKQDINDQMVVGRVLFVAGLGAEYNIGGNTSLFGAINWNNGLTNAFGKKATFYKYDADGNPEIDPEGVPVVNGKFKAITNFLSLDLGVYF
jgi:Outer membrane protein beta-barrel domain